MQFCIFNVFNCGHTRSQRGINISSKGLVFSFFVFILQVVVFSFKVYERKVVSIYGQWHYAIPVYIVKIKEEHAIYHSSFILNENVI